MDGQPLSDLSHWTKHLGSEETPTCKIARLLIWWCRLTEYCCCCACRIEFWYCCHAHEYWQAFASEIFSGVARRNEKHNRRPLPAIHIWTIYASTNGNAYYTLNKFLGNPTYMYMPKVIVLILLLCNPTKYNRNAFQGFDRFGCQMAIIDAIYLNDKSPYLAQYIIWI